MKSQRKILQWMATLFLLFSVTPYQLLFMGDEVVTAQDSVSVVEDSERKEQKLNQNHTMQSIEYLAKKISTEKLNYQNDFLISPVLSGNHLSNIQSEIESDQSLTSPDEQTEQENKILDLYQSLKEENDKLFNEETKAKITDKDTIKAYEELKSRVEKFLNETKDFKEEELEKQREVINGLMDEMLTLEKLVPRTLSSEELALEKALREAKKDLGIMEAKDPADQDVVDRIDHFEKLAIEIDNATKTVGQSLEEGKTIASLQAELDQLVEELRKDIQEARIHFKYTDAENGIDLKVFLQDKYGYVEQPLEEGSYYLPQQIAVDLLVQFANNNDGNFAITLDVNDDQNITSSTGVGKVYLAGKEYSFERNEQGQYVAMITGAPKGISEFVLKLGGLFGEYGQKYSLTISGDHEGNVAAKTFEFVITRSPFEDKAEIEGISGYDDEKKKYPEIDAGPKGEDGTIIDEEAKEKEFWISLFKAYGWLDEVLRNGDRDPIDLSYLEITVDLPEHAGNYAEYLYKKGFQFEEITNAQGEVTQLKLIAKVENLQGVYQVEEDGTVNYIYTDGNGNEVKEPIEKIAKEDENQILGENELFKDAQGRYFDNQGNQVYPKEFTYDGQTYVILDEKVLKVIPGAEAGDPITLEELTKEKEKNTFSEIIDDQKVYFEIRKGEVFKYTDKQKVTKGQGVNNDGQADANLQKVEGMIITIENKYFGGKILTDEGTAIFDENGKFVAMNDGSYMTKTNALIGDDGKALDETTTDEQVQNTKEINGQLYVEKVVSQETATYTLVPEAIFDAEGNYLPGYTYTSEDNKVYDENGAEVGEIGNGFTLTENILLDVNGEVLPEPATAEEVAAAQEAGTLTVERVISQETTLLKLVKNAVFDANGYILSGYTSHENATEKAVVDKFGKKLDFTARFDETTQKWTLTNLTDDSKVQKEELTFAEETVYVDASNELISGDNLEIIEEYFYFDGEKFVGVPSEEVKNRVWYEGLDVAVLTNNLAGKTIVEKGEGDLYHLQDSYYKKEGDNFVRVKGENGAIFIGKIPTQVVYQESTTGTQKYVPGASIFDVLKDTKFALTFGGFKPGLDFIYQLVADVRAEFVDLEDGQTKSIFSGNGIKHLIKKFTLKDVKEEKLFFDKQRPEEFEKIQAMNFELFNILYRAKDDMIRDQVLIDMWNNEADHEKIENFLAFLTKEYQKLFGDSYELVIHEDQLQVKFTDDEGMEQFVDPVRSLVWKLSIYNNSERPYPEDASNKIVIEDSLMDNRMVYHEIIVNHKFTYETIVKELDEQKANLAEGEAEPVDPRAKNLFFLEDIDTIYLGVNPYYKDKTFVRVDGFEVTSQAIAAAVEAMADDQTTAEVELGSGIQLLVTLDRATGQVHILVKDAFYNAANGTSPVQDAYNEQLEELKSVISEAATAEDIENELQKLFGADFKLANLQISENTSENAEENNGTADKVELDVLKNFLIDRIDSLSLATHPRGDEYATRDGRFNALQIVLNKGAQVGGLIEQPTRGIQISSVLANHVEVPFTNEFGEVLTNYEMYYNAELNKIAKEQGVALEKMSEAEYQKAVIAAHQKVHERMASEGEDHIEIKPLVTFVEETLSNGMTYKVYEAVAGNTLEYGDLSAVDEKVNGAVNPYYVGGKTLKELGITDEDLLAEKIDLLTYYKHELVYNGRYFENKGRMYLDGSEHSPSVFEGSENNQSITRPIGVVPIITSNDSADGGEGGGEELEADVKDAEAEITISKPETTGGGTEDKPKVDKAGNKTVVDLGKENDNRIDFTVNTTIDFKKYEEKILEGILASNGEKTKAQVEQELRNQGYNKDTGFKEIKDGFIIDLLPDEVEVDENSKIQFVVHDTFEANGANKGNKEAFEQGIQVLYIDNLKQYFESMNVTDSSLYKYLEQILTAGQIDYGNGNNFLINKNQRAVLVLLPKFEAPFQKSSKSPVFTLKLLNFKVKENGKEILRENYGAFESSSWSGYDTHKYRVQKPKEGTIDKYLRIYDEKGNVVKDVEEWFKGKVNLTFGDKFDYKLKFQQDATTDTSGQGGFGALILDYKLEDYLPQVGDGQFKPVLRGPVEFPDDFGVIYFDVDGNEIKELEGNYHLVASIRIVAPQKLDPVKGFEVIIPMEIPELQVEFEDGKAQLVGGEYFDLETLLNNGSLIAENKAGDSNTVTVEIHPNEQITLKKYWSKDGKLLTDEELAALKTQFQIIREYTDDEGEVISEVVEVVELNTENNFQVAIKDLPQKMVMVEIAEDGTITKKEFDYTYQVEEIKQSGWTVEEVEMDGRLVKVFVNKKDNTPDEPNEPGTPPEEPEQPSEPGEPEQPSEPEEPGQPGQPGKDQPTNNETKVEQSKVLPNTGTQAQLSIAMLAALMILVGFMLVSAPSKE